MIPRKTPETSSPEPQDSVQADSRADDEGVATTAPGEAVGEEELEPASSDGEESGEDDADPTPETETERLQSELAEVTDARLRLAAELDNFRRRTFKQQAVLRQTATEALVLRLLDVTDALDGALATSGDEEADAGLRTGLELISAKLEGVLAGEGVVRIVADAGSEFDPLVHEALATLPSDEIPEGQVANVVQAGYRMGEKIIRPARVVVSSGGGNESATEGDR